MTHSKEERASIRRVERLIDWLCDDPKPKPKMPSRGRYRYTPALRGWVVTRDMVHELVHSIDCSQGGAQQALDRQCADLQADGWRLEKRFADSLFAHRGSQRVRIGIEAFDPYGSPPRSATTGDFSRKDGEDGDDDV